MYIKPYLVVAVDGLVHAHHLQAAWVVIAWAQERQGGRAGREGKERVGAAWVRKLGRLRQ